MSFDTRKAQILSSPPFAGGRDASPKGSLDVPIVDCIAFINSLQDFVTTSSCAGRIALYLQPESKGVEWLFVEHGLITVADVVNTVQQLPPSEELVMLKCEAFILHLLCRDLPAATLMLSLARDSGYRESGVVVARQITLAVRTTAFGLEMPVAVGNRLLLDEKGLAIAVREANKRVLANFERSDRLLVALKQNFNWPALRIVTSSHPNLNRWGHSSLLVNGEIVTVGGYGADEASAGGASRKLSSIRWSPGTQKPTPLKMSIEVVHGVAVFAESANAIVCSGGRLSPLVALPCLRLFSPDLCPLDAIETGDPPSPRWGHSLTALGPSDFLLYGGRDERQVFGEAFILRYLPEDSSWEWRLLPALPIQGRFFHTACAVGDTTDVILHGGVLVLEDCRDDHRFYRLSMDGRCVEIKVDAGMSFPRFGHTLTYLGTKSYLLLGGTSFNEAHTMMEQSTLTAEGAGLLLDLRVDTLGELIFSVRDMQLDSREDGKLPFQMSRIHHQTVCEPSQGTIIVLGGGIHCLAFGPTYCDSVELSIGEHSSPLYRGHDALSSEVSMDVTPPCEEKPSVVILVPPRCVKSLKVFLEESKCLDKTKRITRFDHQEKFVTMVDTRLSSVLQVEVPPSLFDSMAVPITQDFFNKLSTFEHERSTLSSLSGIIGTSQLYICEQRMRLNKRSQVDCYRKAREVCYPT